MAKNATEPYSGAPYRLSWFTPLDSRIISVVLFTDTVQAPAGEISSSCSVPQCFHSFTSSTGLLPTTDSFFVSLAPDVV